MIAALERTLPVWRDLRLAWSMNNEKLRKLKTVSFGIPAFASADGFRTCPQAGACADLCFARDGWYTLPRVQGPREHNLAAARGDLDLFVAWVVQDLRRLRRFPVVRVHDSGDFFSQEYLDAWFDVAFYFPERTFYSYTKALDLDLWSRLPENFRLVQSEGGLLDERIDRARPHARIFLTLEQLRESGYEDGHETDELAIAGANRIGLLYHGLRPLSEAQERFLARRVS